MQNNKIKVTAISLIVLSIVVIAASAALSTSKGKPIKGSLPIQTVVQLIPEVPTTTVQAPEIGTAVSIVKPAAVTPLPKPKAVKKPVSVQITTTSIPRLKTPLEVAQSMIGHRPTYADKGFWCALFVNDVAQKVGLKNWTNEPGPSDLFNDALRDGRVHPQPQVGDMAFFDLRGLSNKSSDVDIQVMHVGIVETVPGNSFTSIEGNAHSEVVVRRTHQLTPPTEPSSLVRWKKNFQKSITSGQLPTDHALTIAFASFPS